MNDILLETLKNQDETIRIQENIIKILNEKSILQDKLIADLEKRIEFQNDRINFLRENMQRMDGR